MHLASTQKKKKQLQRNGAFEIAFFFASLLLVLYAISIILSLGLGYGWLAAICIPLCALAATPLFPLIGMGAFLILLHGMPRYSEDFAQIQTAMPLFPLVALTVFIGWVIYQGKRDRPISWQHPVCIICALYFGWLCICFLIGYINTYQWSLLEFSRHHPINHVEGFLMFLVSYHILHNEQNTKWLSAIFIISIAAGAIAHPGKIYLNSDLGAMAPIALPLAILLIWLSRKLTVRLVGLVIATGLVGVVLFTQNRAGLVGLTVASVFTVFLAIPNKKLGVGALAILTILATLAIPSSYIDRFSVLWNPNADHATANLDRATIEGRLKLWECGINFVTEEPLWGVGTGNFPKVVSQCDTGLERLPAHNNFVNVAAESGLTGVLLYLALIFAVYYAGTHQISTIRDWNSAARRTLIASFTAYLAVSFFVSRHDMVFAYILMGWIAALDQGKALNTSNFATKPRSRTAIDKQ